MNPTQKRSIRCVSLFTLSISLLAGLLIASLPQKAFAQGRDMGESPVWMWRNQGGGSGGNNSYIAPSGPSQAEIAAQQAAQQAEQARHQRLTEAFNSNERGNAFWKKGDLANAVRVYEDAARKSPNDKVIRSNLARAEEALQTQRARAEEERLSKQRDKAAAANMQQAINSFAQTLDAAPASSGGLDFDGRAGGNLPSGGGIGGGLDFISATPGTAKPAAALEFGDPMVVDLRGTTKTSVDPALLKNDSPKTVPSPEQLPKDLIRDAVADTPKGNATVAPMTAKDLDRLERDLQKRLAEATDPRVKAWLDAQLGWALQQKGDTAGAIRAIKEAGALDPDSSMLKLLNTAAIADTKEKLADAVMAAQDYLVSHPDNRVAAGILADANLKLRQATGAAAPNGDKLVVQPGSSAKPPGFMNGSSAPFSRDIKVLAQDAHAPELTEIQGLNFGNRTPPWQEPPRMDTRINPDKYPDLKVNLEKRKALVAELQAADPKTATPKNAEKIKKQVKALDQEREIKEKEIIKINFPDATTVAPL